MKSSQPKSRAKTTPQLVAVPTDTPPELLAEMRSAGFIPIPTERPDRIRLIVPGANMDGSELLMAAMHALCGSNLPDLGQRAAFASAVYRRLVVIESEAAK